MKSKCLKINLSIKNSLKIEKLKLKIVLFAFIATLYLVFLPKVVVSESSYVLPYPSAMPGSKFYGVKLMWDEIKKYWYFGNFGQFHYNLKQSDKYLVEAKTLFNYKQYLLGHKALQKSDWHFEKIYPNLLLAQNNGKNISEKEEMLKEAAQKHIEELKKLKESVPSTFDWTPEKDSPTTLAIWKSLDLSIKQREKIL